MGCPILVAKEIILPSGVKNRLIAFPHAANWAPQPGRESIKMKTHQKAGP